MSAVDELLKIEHDEFREFMEDEGLVIENRQDDEMAKGVYHIGFKSWLRARSLMWLYPHYKQSEYFSLVVQ